jgi:DNA-binding transcriptional regulator LsrR (DeoR family)
MDNDTRKQLLADVANLYFKEKKTQAQIGRSLGYSRSAISRLLSEAEDQGIVEITIKYPISRDYDLESRLKEKYALETAFVVNTGKLSYENTMQVVGRMGAYYLEQTLKDNTLIGIGWGTSLSAVVDSLPNLLLSGTRVVQVIGSVGGLSDQQVDGPGVAAKFARKMNAEYQILHSPLFLDSVAACQTMKAQKQIAKTLKDGENAEVIILGIGTVEVDPVFSSIFRSGFMDEKEITEVMERGGVGNFCGLILDREGEILDIEANRRSMAVNLEELRERCGKIIGVAAGRKKSHAIESILKGKWLDVLITDSAAARPIVDK